jgi:multicomponent Na+:H+ antiporter subunit B
MTAPDYLTDPNTLVNFALLGMMMALAFGVARTRNLLAAILLLGVFSLVAAIWLLVADAADVSFTEATVGAGASTVIALGAILLTDAEAAKRPARQGWMAGLVAAAVGGLLAYAALDLPLFGDPGSPANAHVGRYYLEHASKDIAVPNVVTAVLASYRGFDTLGETTVVFAAGLGVALLLGFGERALADLPPQARSAAMETMAESDHHVVLQIAAKLFIPILILFAFYVTCHGKYSAGGGFQGGVTLGAAIILHALVFGLNDTMNAVRPGFARAMASLGVLLFAMLGVASILNGGRYLDFNHLFPEGFAESLPGAVATGGKYQWGQYLSILTAEIGVMMTVAATVVTIFYAFAGRAPDALADEDNPA